MSGVGCVCVLAIHRRKHTSKFESSDHFCCIEHAHHHTKKEEGKAEKKNKTQIRRNKHFSCESCEWGVLYAVRA